LPGGVAVEEASDVGVKMGDDRWLEGGLFFEEGGFVDFSLFGLDLEVFQVEVTHLPF
jgi:hypothetical protein